MIYSYSVDDRQGAYQKGLRVQNAAETVQAGTNHKTVAAILANAARVVNITAEKSPPVTNPFRKIGRNDKISVRYSDGRIVEAKFKFLERDLAIGACEIIQPD
jgi:hypothetical protein